MRDEESWLESLQGQFNELNREMNKLYGIFASKFLPVVRHGYEMIKTFGKSKTLILNFIKLLNTMLV